MASVTEIIQKADGLDFYDAEIVSKGQIEVFAYNNIGKFSQSLNSYIFLVFDEISKACMILSPISGLLYNLIVNTTGEKKYGLVG